MESRPSPGSQRGAIHPPVRESSLPERPAMRPPVRRPGSVEGVVRVAKSSVEPVTPPISEPAPQASTLAPIALPMPPVVPIQDIVKPHGRTLEPLSPPSTEPKVDLPAMTNTPEQPSFGSNTPVNRKKWLLIGGVSLIVIIIGVITFTIL